MTQYYYAVIDFEGNYEYFYSKKRAMNSAKKLYDEAIDMGYENPDVELKQFTLPKLPKKELVLRLLNDFKFMENTIKIDFLNK